MPDLAEPGQMTALVGTAEEVAPFLERPPEGASSGPVAMFMRDGKTKSSVLVVSGPDWPAVQEAIEGITQPMDRPSNVPRDVIATGRWLLPGFHDAHVHPVQAGLEMNQCDLTGTIDVAVYLERVATYAAANPQRTWITGGGWSIGTSGFCGLPSPPLSLSPGPLS